MKYNLQIDVPVEDFFEKSQDALQKHWEELAGNKDKIKLTPDIPKYKQLQQMGILHNIVAYTEDGELIGYSVIFVQPHLHYMNDIFAYVDVIFLKEEYRNSRIGLVLIKETETLSKTLGVSVLSYHTKPYKPAIEKILVKNSFHHSENIFTKYIKG